MTRDREGRVRVLYSFPHRLGAQRICYTAWQQVNGLVTAGAEVVAYPASVEREVPHTVEVRPTLARGAFRIPYRVLGNRRAFALHDQIVSRRLRSMGDKIDIVHVWSQGALRTLGTAEELGIPTVLERPNAHTRFAFEVVREECERLGVQLPTGHEHAFDEEVLALEEEEFERAYRLLCPSDFVVRTYRDKGFAPEKLVRHIYGVDNKTYRPEVGPRKRVGGLTALFVGVCAVRKGVHYALQAWLKSSAHVHGSLLIAGEFLPAYADKLAPLLSHPSVQVLGHRTDVPELMRASDILLLPSIEEGFGLVCTEAMSSGCVPLVSDACTELCSHMDNSLVHGVGDVEALANHISLVDADRSTLWRLRERGLSLVPEITWDAAGARLLSVYRDTISAYERARR